MTAKFSPIEVLAFVIADEMEQDEPNMEFVARMVQRRKELKAREEAQTAELMRWADERLANGVKA